jgi:aspartate-semialdehyde dehydrogenase
MVNETKKIFADETIRVTATACRVPVFYCHSECVNIETKKKISANEVRDLLAKAENVVVMDDPKNSVYPLATLAVGKNDTFVGRIREDISIDNGIEMFIVSDNLRKGAAFNAVQIAEVVSQDL